MTALVRHGRHAVETGRKRLVKLGGLHYRDLGRPVDEVFAFDPADMPDVGRAEPQIGHKMSYPARPNTVPLGGR